MSKGSLLYAQSGGVTAVINASAAAVIQAARKARVRVLAGRNGILGALREELVDTSKLRPSRAGANSIFQSQRSGAWTRADW